jgi:hypothetical protein
MRIESVAWEQLVEARRFALELDQSGDLHRHTLKLEPFWWAVAAIELVAGDVARQVDLSTEVASLRALEFKSAWCWFEIPLAVRGWYGADRIERIAAIWSADEDELQLNDEHDDAEDPIPSEEQGSIAAVSWEWQDSGERIGLLCKTWFALPSCIVPMTELFVPEGSPLVDAASERGPKDEVDWPLQFVVAANAFFRTRLPAIESHVPDRAARRRAARLSGVSGDDGCVFKVVQLRERERERSEPVGGNVDWNCRWIVRSHLRRQWYPSRGLHLPVVVPEYVKGPSGRPLKVASALRVFSVRR